MGNGDINLLMQKTGLNYNESRDLLAECSGDIDKALSVIAGVVGTILAKDSINEGIKNIEIYKKLAENLSKYNTNRGGVNGFKGFVFEELHAANATINGQPTQVIANNGIADFKITTNNGGIINGQAKVGYKNTSVNLNKYEGQTIVVDKGNKSLINKAKEVGLDTIESNVSEKNASSLAKGMQTENKITRKSTSKIVPKIHSNGQIIKQCHNSGINSAKNGMALGAGLSLGSNMVEVLTGDKKLSDAAVNITKDTALAAGTSYIIGATTTAVASTTVGATAIGAATAVGTAVASSAIGAATTVGTAVASTAVGGVAVGAATAVGTAVASSAIGAATTVGAAVVSTTVGGAAVGVATAVGTAVAGTAVGAATIAAAPVVLAGAAIGGVFTLGKKLFGR